MDNNQTQQQPLDAEQQPVKKSLRDRATDKKFTGVCLLTGLTIMAVSATCIVISESSKADHKAKSNSKSDDLYFEILNNFRSK